MILSQYMLVHHRLLKPTLKISSKIYIKCSLVWGGFTKNISESVNGLAGRTKNTMASVERRLAMECLNVCTPKKNSKTLSSLRGTLRLACSADVLGVSKCTTILDEENNWQKAGDRLFHLLLCPTHYVFQTKIAQTNLHSKTPSVQATTHLIKRKHC